MFEVASAFLPPPQTAVVKVSAPSPHTSLSLSLTLKFLNNQLITTCFWNTVATEPICFNRRALRWDQERRISNLFVIFYYLCFGCAVFFLVDVVFVFTLVLAVVVNRIGFVFIVERCPLLLCFVYYVCLNVLLLCVCVTCLLCPIVVLLPLGWNPIAVK
jgi:hypothetical protein